MIGRLALALAIASSPALAAPPQRIDRGEGVQLAPVVVQLDGVPTGSLVTMLLRDIMRVPYVIAPDVLADRRPTSVRLIMPRHQIPQKVVGFLRASGLSVALEGGTVYVGRRGHRWSAGVGAAAPGRQLQNPEALGRAGADVPSGSPVDLGSRIYPVARPEPYQAPEPGPSPVVSAAPSMPSGPVPDMAGPQELLGYIPAHRSPAYLASVIQAVLPGIKIGAREQVRGNSDQGVVESRDVPDVLVLAGGLDELGRARRLIELLDRPRPMVAVKAVVMQVQDVQARGSALSILASFAGGKVKVGSYGAEPPGSQFVRIASGAVSAVLSAVREDSRFKVVATPNLAALSGATATMNAGSQVPTVGSVSIAEGGTPVQSVVYRDSGITLTVRPTVRGELVELQVEEERSTFVRTTTGVEDSPTLQKSSASASVVLKSGESVVLSGLTEQSNGNRREGLFGGLLGVRSRDKSESELLVVLTAEIVPTPSAGPGQFVPIGDSPDALDTDAKRDPLAASA